MSQLLANRSAFESLSRSLLTDDGLLPCSAIRISSDAQGYGLILGGKENIELFPVPQCDFVVSYLVEHPELWDQAAIHVRCTPSIWGSAPMFGVPFKRAVEIAIQQGYMRSKYFLPDTEQDGRYKTLLMQIDHASDVRGKLMQLQVWQYSPGGSHAHYIHALSSDFQSHVCHLDGATIRFSESDLDILLLQSRKVKGDQYQKHFRLDGQIEIEHMHSLASAFLPGVGLYDEAFEIKVLEPYA